MQNEKNQFPVDIKVHDIVFIWANQRTNEDGTKRGYSWSSNGDLGLVTEVSQNYITYKMPNAGYNKYDALVEDKDYYYTIGLGSEVEYQAKIDAHIEKLIEERDKKNKEIKEVMQWRHDFEHSISLLGKIARFVRFNK